MAKTMSARDVAAFLCGKFTFVTDDADTIHRYNGAFYEALKDAEIRQLCYQADPFGTPRKWKEAADMVRARSYVPALEWGRVGNEEVACLNAVIDLETLEPRAHRADDRLEKVIPHEWQP